MIVVVFRSAEHPLVDISAAIVTGRVYVGVVMARSGGVGGGHKDVTERTHRMTSFCPVRLLESTRAAVSCPTFLERCGNLNP